MQRYKNVYVPSIAKPVATKIYNKYVLRHAPEEVNISHDAHEDVKAGIALGMTLSNLIQKLTLCRYSPPECVCTG